MEEFNRNSGTGVQRWKYRFGSFQTEEVIVKDERRDDLLTQKHKEKGKDTGQPGDRQRRKIKESKRIRTMPC